MLELLESRRLLTAGGGNPGGVATEAGPDTNIWLTLGTNSIGMVNPANPGAGITQYAIPTPNSGPGPIAAGPQAILYASDISKGQIYKVDTTTGVLLSDLVVAVCLESGPIAGQKSESISGFVNEFRSVLPDEEVRS